MLKLFCLVYCYFLLKSIVGCLLFINYFVLDIVNNDVLYIVIGLNLYIYYMVKVVVINEEGEGYFVNEIVRIDEEGIKL